MVPALYALLCNGSYQCCYKFFRLPMNKNIISSYSMTDPRCTKTAVILITHRKRNICADPSQPWVKNVMNFLDRKSF
uniref:Chemokine interleukin-8-like domain-containing protein n=1 Tax=Xiphophorus maculatus TaxID=8083 RepID=A0A3B5QI13_XIPMA